MADAPKIQIDSDWKAQAQKEKQKLAEQSKAKTAGPGGAAGAGERQLPPANFEGLIATLASSALYALGGVQDPQTGQRVVMLDLARHHIDLLTVLEEKTKGNVSEEESTMLAQTLYELRSRYVQIASSARAGG